MYYISYDNKHINDISSIKFLGLIINDTLSWKSHIDQFMSKLSSVCYAVRTVKAVMTPETLTMICFSYIHSVMTYWYNFGG